MPVTIPRGLLVLLLIVLLGVAIVLLSQESAKAANRIQKLHQERIALEQQLWGKQLELAKLCAPEAIRQRAEELGFDLAAPSADEDGSAAAESAME